jgi:hypothetical protein
MEFIMENKTYFLSIYNSQKNSMENNTPLMNGTSK